MTTATTKLWTKLSVEEQELLIKSCFEGSPFLAPLPSEPELNTSPAKQFSYSPYSGFRVGAALLTVDGQIIKGACIDNASYCKYITELPPSAQTKARITGAA